MDGVNGVIDGDGENRDGDEGDGAVAGSPALVAEPETEPELDRDAVGGAAAATTTTTTSGAKNDIVDPVTSLQGVHASLPAAYLTRLNLAATMAFTSQKPAAYGENAKHFAAYVRFSELFPRAAKVSRVVNN
jgi:hypothetical protein